MAVVGFDPGAKGAIALMSNNGDLIGLADMPMVQMGSGKAARARVSAAGIAALIRDWKPSSAIVERVGAMPGNGVSSMFAFGYGAGAIEGVLAALGVPVMFAMPAVWKAAMKLTRNKGQSRMMALHLFPSHAASFALVKHDGRAEAALLAFYGLQNRAGMRLNGVGTQSARPKPNVSTPPDDVF